MHSAKHVKSESERLKEINDIYTTYKAAIGTLCDTLNSLKSTLDKPDLKTWRDDREDAATVDGFKYLEGTNLNTLRDSCSNDDLKSYREQAVANNRCCSIRLQECASGCPEVNSR